MDLNLLFFIAGVTFLLSLLTYGEWLYRTGKRESEKEISLRRLEGWIRQAKEMRLEKKVKGKHELVDHLLKFRLEYDPDTHTYVKVETMRPDETEVIRIK